MPTGYTAFIESGDITTGKDFLKLCTRAFGIAISMRDEPLSVPTPKRFEPDPYYENRYREAVAELEEAKQLTIDKARDEMKAKRDRDIIRCKKYIRKYEALNTKYETIGKEIENWIPPTVEHNELKKFALNQINISLENTRYYQKDLDELTRDLDLSDEAVLAYISEKTNDTKEEVERAYERYQEEIKRTESRNKWISEFYRSIGEADI